MRWVLGILKREKKKITRPDMELFLEKTGSDMGNIHMELQKLLDYTWAEKSLPGRILRRSARLRFPTVFLT